MQLHVRTVNNEVNLTKRYTYCIWHSLCVQVSFIVCPNNSREWVVVIIEGDI